MKRFLEVLASLVLVAAFGATEAQACGFTGRPLLRSWRFVARVVTLLVRGVQAVAGNVAERVESRQEARAERPVQTRCPSGRCAK